MKPDSMNREIKSIDSGLLTSHWFLWKTERERERERERSISTNFIHVMFISEFEILKQSDTHRLYQLRRHTSKNDHAYNRFTAGTQ